MTAPVTTAPAAQPSPAFLHMISLFLSSPSEGTSQQDTSTADTANAPATTGSPAQIAEAMIRSMLGSPILRGPAQGGSTSSTPVSGNASQGTASTTAQTGKGTPGTVNPNQTAASNPQLPGAPGIATILVIAPSLIAGPLASTLTSPTPPVGDSRSNTQVQNNLAPGSILPLAKGSPESKVAFTAILTPTNEMAPNSATAAAGKQISISPEPATSVSSSIPLASAPPSSSTPPPATAQGTGSQTAVQATAENSSGETPSNPQGDSADTPAQSIVLSADAKNKTAIKQDDDTPAIITAAGSALQDHTVTSLTDPNRAPASAATATPSEATSSQTAAEALRTSESELVAAPPARTGAAQEITIRIEQPDAAPVDLRVVERSGQVHIDVRTPDAAMQTSLREDLGTLTNSLQRAGYHAEMFTPASALGRTASSAQTSNQDDHQDSSQNRGGSGDSSEGRRQQQQQKRPGTWLEELEDQK